jgi:hypothetical protein
MWDPVGLDGVIQDCHGRLVHIGGLGGRLLQRKQRFDLSRRCCRSSV